MGEKEAKPVKITNKNPQGIVKMNPIQKEVTEMSNRILSD